MNETGLRRRFRAPEAAIFEDDEEEEAVVFAQPRRDIPPPPPTMEQAIWRLSRLYCSISTIFAILAIVTAPTSTFGQGFLFLEANHSAVTETTAASAAAAATTVTTTTPEANWWGGTIKHDKKNTEEAKLPPWLRWIPLGGKTRPEELAQTTPHTLTHHATQWLQSCIDPGLLQEPTPQTLTALIDKVIHSTPRLLAIANLLLSFTFLLHTFVANWFLGARHDAAGRERLAGFLIFKLLLMSVVVVQQDTLNWLILLSWYTMLSFFKSLTHLCANTTQHTIQSGQSAKPGVLQLLLGILVADCLAAALCVALFHTAGWSMVVLLTCDCALLALDIICNVLQHVGQVLDVQHEDRVLQEGWPTVTRLEQEQVRRVYILETAVFFLQLLKHVLTVMHFLHIWNYHGVQFDLIDGVLALHLHAALSSASKKIAERRNLYRIARDMDGMFADATDMELRKAVAAGDVCCICLGTFMGSCKKVACGHLYHTSCLREVIERARSMEAARCPLCRASITPMNPSRSETPLVADGGTANHVNRANIVADAPGAAAVEPAADINRTIATEQSEANESAAATVGTAPPPPPPPQPEEPAPVAGPVRNNAGDHALFRFSTEGFLPGWVPLPSFSFEVIRRPNNAAAPEPAEAAAPNEPPQPSLLRRLLLVSGVVAMTPEEERAELERLVDTFPQYERQDLLFELRRRGSADGVARAILDRQELIVPADQ